MDFYVTLPSGPSPNFPGNQPNWSEFIPKNTIELVGEYQVALVQSVFKGVFSTSLATINILATDSGMEMHTFKLQANDGDSPETIIRNINYKFYNSFKLNSPYFTLNKETHEFEFHNPEGWHHLIMDVDLIYITSQTQNKFKFKFNNRKFYHPRHFYVFSDLIGDQILGNTIRPLLTNFCLSDTKNNVVEYTPKSPRYVDVKENTIKNFYIEYSPSIYSGTQLTGEIISTLHFKKKDGF